jgi:hypothetical protein
MPWRKLKSKAGDTPMTLKLQLSTNLERRLEAEASKLGLVLEAYALALLEKQVSAEAGASRPVPVNRPRRQPGSAKGLIRLMDDFDQPLEDFEAYR